MQLYAINLRVLLRNERLIALLALIFICIFLLTTCDESNSDPNGSTSVYNGQSAVDGNNIVEDSN